ncbi:hypothetical protein QR680_010886 [Steinernema hermaphroditum]|uniref:Uncharacterized protein n=1 Tax=Steinernema hermaphroditum TaxID=289476 RepID=A0AA39MCA4_9BILA|nr:hypothetical protein QR680_010886 [Steinernema hermaphroditum]
MRQATNNSHLRSQSFRHRSRPPVEVRRFALEDVTQERRRSTPTVSRRCSLQRSRADLNARINQWPEPPQVSEIQERFLKLPDSEDYTRVRQFRIDAKGAVVSRGDSFRRKHHKGEHTPSPLLFPIERRVRQKSTSLSSSSSGVGGADIEAEPFVSQPIAEDVVDESPTTSHKVYKIYVLGVDGTGKTAMINQFMTSEHRNPFAVDIEDGNADHQIVSINLGGQLSDLVFMEADPQHTNSWQYEEVHAYVLCYSIDSRSSFREAMSIVEDLRESRGSQKHVPIILAGNKADLERKRAVSKSEVRNAAATYGFAHFEVSVALNLNIDDLLVGILAEIKEYTCEDHDSHDDSENRSSSNEDARSRDQSEDFRAAMRRFSQRKKRQMGVGDDVDGSRCAAINPTGLFERFRQWKRGFSKC